MKDQMKSDDIELTDHQAITGNLAAKSVRDGGDFVLRGIAGSGKTFLVAKLLPWLEEERGEVTMIAPTHTAARNLEEKLPRGHEVSTIASFLGMRPKKRGGKQTFEVDPTARPPEPARGSVLVVEEASMPSSEAVDLIEEKARRLGLVILWVGDPAQLPPVGEDLSPGLIGHGAEMTEPVRQAEENPILGLATTLRSEIPARFEEDLDSEGNGVALASGDLFLEAALASLTDPQVSARIITWTNRSVRRWNERVREGVFGAEKASEPYRRGERLIAYGRWEHPASHEQILNRSEHVIRSKRNVSVRDPSPDFHTAWKALELSVRPVSSRDLRRDVKILVPRDSRIQKRLDKELSSRAKACRGGDASWRQDFWPLKELLADMRYAYSATSHISQGQGFDEVFIDLPDMMKNRDASELRRLLYTAVTRARRKVTLLDS